jgi:hypothetical protein
MLMKLADGALAASARLIQSGVRITGIACRRRLWIDDGARGRRGAAMLVHDLCGRAMKNHGEQQEGHYAR